jgi:cell division protein ZapE
VRFGSIQPDGSQLASVQALHLLQGVLTAQAAHETAAAACAAGSAAPTDPAVLGRRPSGVQGAYMWGPPGRGKKMIMQLFSRTLPPVVKMRHHSLPWLLRHVEERCHELEAVMSPETT